jgi:hypothetical protein
VNVRFEVFIPAAPPEQPFAVTLRVEADTWLGALKAGVHKICGVQVAANILCDVRDDRVIDVTDPATGRVFRISEVAAGAPAAGGREAQPGAGVRPAQAPPAAPAVEEVAEPAAPVRRPVGRTPHELDREELLAELFLRAPQVASRRSREDGLGYLLELAMEKVRCEAGSAFLSSADGLLSFAAVRGPKAAEVMKLAPKIPMGVGVVGFCAQESVALAVSDAERDGRFFRGVSDAVKHPTRSLVCAPIALGGRVFGALELVNRRDGSFDEADLAILSYLAHQAAGFLAARDAAAT